MFQKIGYSLLENNTKIYHTKNYDNELFYLNYVIDMGIYQDKYLNIAFSYFEYTSIQKH